MVHGIVGCRERAGDVNRAIIVPPFELFLFSTISVNSVEKITSTYLSQRESTGKNASITARCNILG